LNPNADMRQLPINYLYLARATTVPTLKTVIFQ
jgi:hypothetical protein